MTWREHWILIFVLTLLREKTEKAQAEALAREEELQQKVIELEMAKKEVEESLEIHLEEASQQVTEPQTARKTFGLSSATVKIKASV